MFDVFLGENLAELISARTKQHMNSCVETSPEQFGWIPCRVLCAGELHKGGTQMLKSLHSSSEFSTVRL